MVALLASDRCFAHDPQRAGEREAARRKGGRNRSGTARLRGLMPPRLVPVFDRLETTLERLDAGAMDPRQAQAMAAVARAMVAVLQAGELEERLRWRGSTISMLPNCTRRRCASWRCRRRNGRGMPLS